MSFQKSLLEFLSLNTSKKGNINIFGWKLSKKLGKLLKDKYSKIKIIS
jgi:hypothetical protein